MTNEAKKLLGEKIEQLKNFRDGEEVFIFARDLKAFGLPVPDDSAPKSFRPVLVGALRAVANTEAVTPYEEGCGCGEPDVDEGGGWSLMC